jgi:hypothetical protein
MQTNIQAVFIFLIRDYRKRATGLELMKAAWPERRVLIDTLAQPSYTGCIKSRVFPNT